MGDFLPLLHYLCKLLLGWLGYCLHPSDSQDLKLDQGMELWY